MLITKRNWEADPQLMFSTPLKGGSLPEDVEPSALFDPSACHPSAMVPKKQIQAI
jgi:hypothetical protein